jgi:hypothetical protein
MSLEGPELSLHWRLPSGHQSGFAAMLTFNRLLELVCAHFHGFYLAWFYRAPFIELAMLS